MQSAELRDMGVACVEEIFLAKVAEFSADFLCDREMIIDDKSNPRFSGDGKNGPDHAADFIQGGLFGSKLDQIRAAITKLLCHGFRRAPAQAGRVHKSIKPAF